jgi:hypothetical protein
LAANAFSRSVSVLRLTDSTAAVGSRGALWVACLLTLVTPMVLWFSPVRRLRDLTGPTETRSESPKVA